MTRGFWDTLSYPIIGLAPMDGVTDATFRALTARYGHPSITFTEFTAAEGIRAGAERLLEDFLYCEEERPVLGQIFGADPDAFFIASAVVSALGFNGIDINMGCPAKSVAQRGAGASLILDPERATEIIRKTKAGNKAWAEGSSLQQLGVPENLIPLIEARRNALGITSRQLLPVSVKTRIGYDSVTVEDWVQHLLEETPANITLHGRTLKQLYTGFADWDAISRAAKIIHSTGTSVLGNGDVKNKEDALEHCTTYGVDGVLIGRAAFGNPWIFTDHTPTEKERLEVALEHATYFAKTAGEKNFVRMRKHLLDYTRSFDGAKELRSRLMRVSNLAEVESIIRSHIDNHLIL